MAPEAHAGRGHDAHHDHDPDFDPALVLRVISLLRRLGAAINEWQRSETAEGFTINQALVLHHLVSHGDATPSDLATWMQVTRGSVTPTVKRLEDLGLVSRRIDDLDGRKQWLTATPEAHEIAAEVEAQTLDPVASEFMAWDAAALRRFCDEMEEVLKSPFLGGRP